MKKKLLCLVLAALMLTSVCAFAEGETETIEQEQTIEPEQTNEPEQDAEEAPLIDVDATPAPDENETVEITAELDGVFQFGDLYGEQLSLDFEQTLPAMISTFADETDDGSLTTAKLAEFTLRVQKAILDMSPSVEISDLNINYSESIQKVLMARISAVMNSEARSFVYGNSVSFTSNGTKFIMISLNLKADAKGMRDYYDSEKQAVLNALFPNGTSGMTKTEIALAIHDYLALHTRYDFEFTNTNMHNAYGALVNGIAVCQGYAMAYMDLLKEMDVGSYFVSSENLNHGWNIIETENGWYYSDVTWDDPGISGEYTNDSDYMGYCGHSNFINTAAQLRASHFKNVLDDSIVKIATGSSPVVTYNEHPNSAFWAGLECGMVYTNGLWYYNDAVLKSSTNGIYMRGNICSTPYGTERQANVIAADATPFAAVDGSLVYARFSADYVTDAIMCYDTATGAVKRLAAPIDSGTMVTEIAAGRLNIGNEFCARGMVVYADANSKLYRPIEPNTIFTIGDVNGDGKLTIADVTLICRHIMGQTQLSGAALTAADINADGSVGVADAVLLCQMISEGNE